MSVVVPCFEPEQLVLGRLAGGQHGEVAGVTDLDAQLAVMGEHQVPRQVGVWRVAEQTVQRAVKDQQGGQFVPERDAALEPQRLVGA